MRTYETSPNFRSLSMRELQWLYIHRFIGSCMKKLKIAIAIIIISIVGALTNSISFPISEAQSTTNANNNTQPINQGKEIQLELTPQETITESDNLQNPSIQTALQQQQQQSQSEFHKTDHFE